jgi:N-acetylmuramoyl-L-alanine amidase
MRKIDEIVIHCTATTGNDRGDVSVDEVRRWHMDGNGWSDVGYHFLIRRDGALEGGRPLDKPGAHTKGHNKTTIGIAYTGGICPEEGTAEDTRTDEQKETLFEVLIALKRIFPGIRAVSGHRDHPGVRKACPCFDVEQEFGFLFR